MGMRLAIAAIALMVAVGLIVLIEGQKDDSDTIPVPPIGYEYCATNGELGFCKEDQ